MNTNIEYKDTKDFTEKELEELFLSVEWSSGHFPDKLVVAMKNFKTVYSAWDGNKLVGMVCAMDDGIMNAYVHYLLVNPQYHGQKNVFSIFFFKTGQFLSYFFRFVFRSGHFLLLSLERDTAGSSLKNHENFKTL